VKAKEINGNIVLFSEKMGRYGQVLARKGFMCLTIFVGGEALWLPASDLHRMCPEYEKKFNKIEK